MLGVLITPSTFAQNQTISIHYDPVHYFFFGNDIYGKRTSEDVFKIPFHNLIPRALGIEYSRYLNKNSRLGVELDLFAMQYYQNSKGTIDSPALDYHGWFTIGVNYSRDKLLSPKFNFRYGAGVNFRYGKESIILGKIPLGFGSEIISTGGLRRDIGLNAFGQIEYLFSKKWFAYSKVDFLGIVYVHDKDYKFEMVEYYNSPHFPTRLDLSLKFGIGVKF